MMRKVLFSGMVVAGLFFLSMVAYANPEENLSTGIVTATEDVQIGATITNISARAGVVSEEIITPVQVQPELKLIRATCYCSTGNPTASGVMPYYGVIAGRPEDLGKIAILYTTEKEYIGIFEFRDTGGARSLKDGTSIDVYLGELDRCYEWIAEYGDYVYIQIIEAEG